MPFPTSGLQHYYKLDGNSNDAVGSYNGTDTSITYSAGNGKIVQGAGFGASSVITRASPTDMHWGSNSTFSVNFWYKGTHSMGAFVSVFQGSSPFVGWTLYRNDAQAGTNGIYFFMYNGSLECKKSSNGTQLGGNPYDGNWHMITVTYSGGASIANMSLYLDGVAATTFTNASCTGSFNPSYSYPLTFGGENGTAGLNPGAIDEMGFWNRALSGSEVTELYNSGAGLAYSTYTNTSGFFLAAAM